MLVSEQNPYARYLDGRPLEAILAGTPPDLAALHQAFGTERIKTPLAPGKWNPAQVTCHLADCELAFGFRLRQTLAEENHVIQPFDQDRWATPYGQIPAEDALAAFTALRRWNLVLIAVSLPKAGDRRATHPERGEMTFRTIVETMAGHDINHLSRLKAVV